MKKILFLFSVFIPGFAFCMQENGAAANRLPHAVRAHPPKKHRPTTCHPVLAQNANAQMPPESQRNPASGSIGIIPDGYFQAFDNARNAANRVATVTRAKSRMAKPILAGFIAAGFLAGGYVGLKIPQQYGIFLRSASSIYAGLGVSAIGAIVGRLTSWLWYRHPLKAVKTSAHGAAQRLHTQATPFLQSLINSYQSTQERRNVISNAVKDIHGRLHIGQESRDQHFIDAFAEIVTASIDNQSTNSQNSQETELEKSRAYLAGAFVTFLALSAA